MGRAQLLECVFVLASHIPRRVLQWGLLVACVPKPRSNSGELSTGWFACSPHRCLPLADLWSRWHEECCV